MNLTYKTYTVQTNFACGGVSEYNQAVDLPDRITLADSSYYQFTYEPTPANSGHVTGRLASIRLPSGGTISYQYTGGSNGINCADGTPTGITRTTTDGSRTYVRSSITATTSHTDIADGQGNHSTFDFVTAGSPTEFFETNVARYAGAASGTPLLSRQTCYNGTASPCTTTAIGLPVAQIDTYETLNGGAENGATVKYNSVGLQTEQDTYDFGPGTRGALLRKETWVWPTTGILNLVSSHSVVDGNNNQLSQTTYAYDETTGPGHAPLAAPSGVPQHGGAVSSQRGNLTTTSNWLNTSGATVSAEAAYDNTGQAVSSMDARGYSTTYGYDATHTFVTSVTYPTPSSGQAISTRATYDTATGLPLTSTDPNSQTTTYKSYDALLHPTEIDFPDGGKTTYSYTPTEVTASQLRQGSSYINSIYNTDGYGRQSLVTLVDPAGNDLVGTSYDANGRLYSTTNPYRGSPAGATTNYYDALGRLTSQTQPDGSSRSRSYSGNTSTLKDEVGSQWQQTSDGLGRLTKVLEPSQTSKSPTIETDYTYNTNGGFTTNVYQQGVSGETARMRTFISDSLGRTITATTPESGTIGYGYDVNGNLLAKTDASNTTIHYAYDSLNRLTSKTASGIKYGYYYDTPPPNYPFPLSNGVGRLTEASNGVNASSQFSYDPMGRTIWEGNCTPSNCQQTANPVTMAYDLAGNMTSLTYPDGRVVTQGWDNAAHLASETYASFNGNSVNYNYLSSATYFPSGSPQTLVFGNGATQTLSLNSRLQPTEVSLQAKANGLNQKVLDKQFCYGPSATNCSAQGSGVNNGNILSMPDALQSGATQTFGYDNLNRLSSFGTGNQSMSQSFAYDSFGNMNQVGPGTQQTNLSFNARNQISNSSYTYDANGRLTQFNPPTGGTQILTYDAQGNMTNANNGAGVYSYNYDALNNRVRKDVGSNWTEYIYLGSQTIAEKNFDGSWSDYIYANGNKIARADTFDRRIHIHGTTQVKGSAAKWDLPIGGYVIPPQATLCWRQYQAGTYGGIGLGFTDGTTTNWIAKDADGQVINNDQVVNTWHSRCVNFGPYAGKTIQAIWINSEVTTPPGTWAAYFSDIAFTTASGVVYTVYSRQAAISLNPFTTGTVSNTGAVIDTSNTAGDTGNPTTTTTYYHGDHLGSTRVTMTAEGWPVSAETYYPFGLEQSVPADANHYKFTGYERDAESNLDHATFRQLSYTQGRWTSPDPYDGSYSWANPQTFNRYAYVLNNPMIYSDPDGLDQIIDLGDGCYLDIETYSVTSGEENPAPSQADEVEYCLPNQNPSQNLTSQDDQQNNSADAINLDPIQLAPNSAPQVPHTCQQNRILNAVPGSTLTNPNDTVGTSVGGHSQFGINVTTAQLGAAGFTPFNPFGHADGYHNGNIFFQVHDNGAGGIVTQGHIDVFNPATGLFGFLGHSIVDVGIGTLLQHLFPHSHGLLDPGC